MSNRNVYATYLTRSYVLQEKKHREWNCLLPHLQWSMPKEDPRGREMQIQVDILQNCRHSTQDKNDQYLGGQFCISKHVKVTVSIKTPFQNENLFSLLFGRQKITRAFSFKPDLTSRKAACLKLLLWRVFSTSASLGWIVRLDFQRTQSS